MWFNLFRAVLRPPLQPPRPDLPPADCPNPGDCLRLRPEEAQAFGDRRAARVRNVNRYRRMLAQQCPCSAHSLDLKT